MEVNNKDLFYSDMIGNRLLSFSYEKPIDASHLKPIEDFLFDGKDLTPFSQELFTYQEARECVLDFDIYTMQENYKKFPNVVDFLMDCYRYAAQEGVMEAYNNIGVFLGMTDRIEEAIPWFEGAAEAGVATGMKNLVAYYGTKGDYDKQFYYVKKLVDTGDATGMWNYALAFHFGYMGRQIDIEKAKGMYQKMMSLAIEDDMKCMEYDEAIILLLKTWACYNLARLRLLTENNSVDNLNSILHLLEDTSYVNKNNPQISDLAGEIRKMLTLQQ
jgi:tetratricopeptide (TPR) repeat protein